MKRFLLDTGVAQDFICHRHGVREQVHAQRHLGHRIGICVPVLGELWAGVEGIETGMQTNLRWAPSALVIVPSSPPIVIWQPFLESPWKTGPPEPAVR
jgi:hypothetical protein